LFIINFLIPDAHRLAVAPACDCEPGYHDNGTLCRICSHECDTCDDHITNDANCKISLIN
jgi:hypothetical protein